MATFSGKDRYLVQSSDVVQDMRVQVSSEADSQKIIWYKERFLGDHEIIENIVHNQTSTICWTVHRPKRGWYIRIQSPTFPPGAFIPLLPIPKNSPHYSEGALSFTSRTNIQLTSHPGDSDSTLQGDVTSPTIHSYPPTPPVALPTMQPPTPAAVQAKLEQLPGKSQQEQSQITEFVLSPGAISPPPPVSSASTSVFTRFMHESASAHEPITLPPILVFHDQTPVLTVGSLTGLIEIDQSEERLLGLDTSFWIAVALTYLEFLEDRDGYLAAIAD
ncbi:hypothetical protein BD779DRAFT_421142 [Infundibulicybe gibba]|nr:hypothetical protein BD779DRAFT_421142 [Infundibulicybe gibba]